MQSPFAKTKNRPKKITSNHCRHPNSILFELVHFRSSRQWSQCRSRWYVSFLTSSQYVFAVFRSIPIALYRHVLHYVLNEVLLCVQTRREYYISFNHGRSFFHLLAKFWISNNTSSIPDVTTRLVQSLNTSNDNSFLDIC